MRTRPTEIHNKNYKLAELLLGIAVILTAGSLSTFVVNVANRNWAVGSHFQTQDISTTNTELFIEQDKQITANDVNSETITSVYKKIENRNSGGSGGTGNSSSSSSTTNYWSYPSVIYPCTRNGNDMLVLVNKKYKLPSSYAPTDLVSISNSGIRVTKSGMTLRSRAVNELKKLVSAAKSEGLDLAATSAYRSYATQQSTYNYWVQYNGGNVDAADSVSARPGHSQHQLGTAVDFTTASVGNQLTTSFANTSEGKWLAANAWKYGFVLAFPSGWESETGFSYEPWHFRYIGISNAAKWKGSGQILEVWLRGKN